MPHSARYSHYADRCEKPRPKPPEPIPPPPDGPPPPPYESASDYYCEDWDFMPHSCCTPELTLAQAQAQGLGYCLTNDYWLVMLHHYDCEIGLFQTWYWMPDEGCETTFMEDMMPIDECVCVDVPCPPP